MLELHHTPISSCSQKVRLALAEKDLEWTGHLVDLMKGEQHAPAYRKLNPQGVVPTLVDDERVLVESSAINEYLDDAYPHPPLRPADPGARHAMRLWTKLCDEQVHPACSVLTYAIAIRPVVLERPREEIEAALEAIPDRRRREDRRSVLELGLDSPAVDPALDVHVELLDRMQAALEETHWLAGADLSLADLAVLPYVLRLEHLAMGALFAGDAHPAVARWLARLEKRPSFATAISAFAPVPVVEGMRRSGEVAWRTLRTRLDG